MQNRYELCSYKALISPALPQATKCMVWELVLS
jgi:hypothetical protein